MFKIVIVGNAIILRRYRQKIRPPLHRCRPGLRRPQHYIIWTSPKTPKTLSRCGTKIPTIGYCNLSEIYGLKVCSVYILYNIILHYIVKMEIGSRIEIRLRLQLSTGLK